MKLNNFLKKLILYSTIIFVALSICFYIFIENGAKYYFSEVDRTEFVQKIKNAPELPENFVEFYNVIYPKNLSNSTWKTVFNNLVFQDFKEKKECLSLSLAIRFCVPFYRSYHSYNVVHPLMMSRYLEKNVTQIECLNYNFNNFNFRYNRLGIESVSQNLFKKPLKNLKPIEMAEIIALMDSPTRYDRFRNPEKAKQRTNYILDKYKNSISFESEIQ